MADIPIINWPEKSGMHKVVQFGNETASYLRFGNRPEEGAFGDFHEFILERFAKEIGIKCIEMKNDIGLTIAALPDDCPYKLMGAGRCTLNYDAKTAEFIGSSRDYRIPINRSHLERIIDQFPGYQIRII